MAAAYLKRMGERIRTRRDELNLSRSDVARRLPGKTNENAIYRWEKGQHRPSDDTLEALAEVLETTVGYFLTDEAGGLETPDLSSGEQLGRIEEKLDRLIALAESVNAERVLALLRAAGDQQDRRSA